MVHPLFASPHNAGGGSYADRDVSQLEKIREEDLAKATKRLSQLQEKLEKLESRKRKPKTYEDDVKKLQEDAIFTTETTDMTIAHKSDPKSAAGAIANAARESKSVSIRSIGQDSVWNAIRSIAIAREYLDDKDDGVDLFVKTEFVMVRLDGRDEDTTAVQMTVFLYKGKIEL